MFLSYSHTILRKYQPRIAAQGIEPCQTKPCQPLSNLQFLITEGFSVTNYTATIHKSHINRNYCSSTRLSGDKDKHARKASNFRQRFWRPLSGQQTDAYSGRSETAILKLFLRYIVQFHADFLPLTARFTPVVSQRSVQDSNLQGEQTPDRIATGSNTFMGTLQNFLHIVNELSSSCFHAF